MPSIMDDLIELGFLPHGGIKPDSYAALVQESFGSETSNILSKNSWFAAAQAVASIHSMTYTEKNIIKQKNEIIKRCNKLNESLDSKDFSIDKIAKTPDEFVAITFVMNQLRQFVEKVTVELIMEEFLTQVQNVSVIDDLPHLSDDDECDCKRCTDNLQQNDDKDQTLVNTPELTLEIPKRGSRTPKKVKRELQTTTNWLTKPPDKMTLTHSGKKVLLNRNNDRGPSRENPMEDLSNSFNSNLKITRPSRNNRRKPSYDTTSATTDSENEFKKPQNSREKVQLLTRPKSILSQAENFHQIPSASQHQNSAANRAVSLSEEKQRERKRTAGRLMTKNSSNRPDRISNPETILNESPKRTSPWNDPSVVSVNLPKAQKYGKPRPIILDASNIAVHHCPVSQSNGPPHKRTFSPHGIELAINFFKDRGHDSIVAILPAYRQFNNSRGNPKQKEGKWYPTVDGYILKHLEKGGYIFYAPSKRRPRQVDEPTSDENSSYLPVNGIVSTSSSNGLRESPVQRDKDKSHKDFYDDLFILRYAAEKNGVVVSNDNYNDVYKTSVKEKRHQLKHVIDHNVLKYMFVKDLFMPTEDPYQSINLSDFLGSESKC